MVGVPGRGLVAGRGAGLAAEAALAPEEGGEAVHEQGPARLVLGLGLDDDQRALALVVHARHLGRVVDLGLGRDGTGQLDLLLAVEQHHGVEGQAFQADQTGQGAEHGEHAEAGQDLEPGLVGVLQLLVVGGRDARTHAEVIEDHVVGVPRGHRARELGAQHLVEVDRHL